MAKAKAKNEKTEEVGQPKEISEGRTIEYPSPSVSRRWSRRLFMLIISGAALLFGAVSFVVYIFNQNIALGAPGVILGIAGFFAFRHYWKQEADIVVEKFAAPQEKCNTLNIYRDKVQFENYEKPLGFPWTCKNDGKKYYVHIHDMPGDGSEPHALILPDQQYRSPEWFAERPLSLPAHRKLFTRREKMGQFIKTALLVAAIVVVWILIITTT